jgi:hypothetical protein
MAPVIIPPSYYAPVPQRRSPVIPALLITGGVVLFLIVVVVGILAVIGYRVEQREKAEAAARRQAEIAAIQQVRQQDSTLSAAMKADIEARKPTSDADLDSMSDRINAYVTAGRQIDTSGCPQDYVDAYSRYLTAWSEESAEVRAHPHVPTDAETTITELGSIFSDDAASSLKQTKDELKAWVERVKARDSEIDKQADAVNALAKVHGV